MEGTRGTEQEEMVFGYMLSGAVPGRTNEDEGSAVMGVSAAAKDRGWRFARMFVDEAKDPERPEYAKLISLMTAQRICGIPAAAVLVPDLQDTGLTGEEQSRFTADSGRCYPHHRLMGGQPMIDDAGTPHIDCEIDDHHGHMVALSFLVDGGAVALYARVGIGASRLIGYAIRRGLLEWLSSPYDYDDFVVGTAVLLLSEEQIAVHFDGQTIVNLPEDTERDLRKALVR